MYKLQKHIDGLIQPAVIREDGWVIPFSPDNTDYQKYLEWLAEGNQPLPAEEQS